MSNNSIELINNKDNVDKSIGLSHEKIKDKSNNYIQQQSYVQGIDFTNTRSESNQPLLQNNITSLKQQNDCKLDKQLRKD